MQKVEDGFDKALKRGSAFGRSGDKIVSEVFQEKMVCLKSLFIYCSLRHLDFVFVSLDTCLKIATNWDQRNNIDAGTIVLPPTSFCLSSTIE